MEMLDELDVGTAIWPVPVEIPEAIPFADDHVHASYDPDAVQRFWLALIDIERIFKVFRSRFVAKPAPCTTSGEPSTLRTPGSRDAPPRDIPVAYRTVAPT
jgi:hypothetical protein